jgi:hypothetical protein
VCFKDLEEAKILYKNEYRATARGNFTDSNDIKSFYRNMNKFEKFVRNLGEHCGKASDGQGLEYVGTAATVRDMVALADVLEGFNEPINYWGFS